MPIVDDDLDEPDEGIRVVLTREGAQVDFLTGRIIDDDPTVVRLSPPAAAVGDRLFENEAAGTSGAWTVTRDPGEWHVDDLDELTVFLNVNPGTAAVDMPGRQTVTVEAGATELAFSPITTDDAVREPSGRVTVSLVAAPDYVVDGPARDARWSCATTTGRCCPCASSPPRSRWRRAPRRGCSSSRRPCRSAPPANS